MHEPGFRCPISVYVVSQPTERSHPITVRTDRATSSTGESRVLTMLGCAANHFFALQVDDGVPER